MSNSVPKVGDVVQFSPIIGGEFEQRKYKVRHIGKLGHGQVVAWLEGKGGCVHLDAIRIVKEDAS